MRALLALAILSLLPSAAAAGYLVNVNAGTSVQIVYGANAFGGSGDTLDVGVLHAQCSDEADVVDVNALGREGGSACGEGARCEHAQGDDPLAPIAPIQLVDPTGEPSAANCSDDGDGVDVTLLGTEGARRLRCEEEKKCEEIYEGDEGDATDVTVGGVEYGDGQDGNDVAALACEYRDGGDRTDVTLLGGEWYDGGDTLDLAVLSTQTSNSGDANGLGVGGSTGLQPRCIVLAVEGPLAAAPLLP